MGRRRNPEGNLYQDRNTGRWRLVQTLMQRDGTTVEKTFRGANPPECYSKRDTYCAEQQLDRWTIRPSTHHRAHSTPVAGEVTLRSWAEEILRRDQSNTDMSDSYRQVREIHARLRILTSDMADLRIDAVRPADVRNWQAQLIIDETSSSTIRGARSFLRDAFRQAQVDGLIDHNPLTPVRGPRSTEQPVDRLSDADLEKVVTVVRDHPNSARWMLTLTTGMRQSEVLGLCWDSIDLEHGHLTVRRQLRRAVWKHGCGTPPGTKPGHTPSHCPQRLRVSPYTDPKSASGRRELYLHSETLKLLRDHRERWQHIVAAFGHRDVDAAAFGHAVFIRADGKQVDHRTDSREWTAILRQAGVIGHGQHAARHTVSTQLLEAGIDTRVVMALLGWSDASMAKRYQHPGENVLREAARRQEEVWRRSSGDDKNVIDLPGQSRRTS